MLEGFSDLGRARVKRGPESVGMNEDSGEGVSAKQAINDLEVRRLAVGLLADWERRPADLDDMIDRVLAGLERR